MHITLLSLLFFTFDMRFRAGGVSDAGVALLLRGRGVSSLLLKGCCRLTGEGFIGGSRSITRSDV
jgi:hypothetical protein